MSKKVVSFFLLFRSKFALQVLRANHFFCRAPNEAKTRFRFISQTQKTKGLTPRVEPLFLEFDPSSG